MFLKNAVSEFLINIMAHKSITMCMNINEYFNNDACQFSKPLWAISCANCITGSDLIVISVSIDVT